ncbi:MAG: polyphenol oxidase family protein [Deltaproteobacteria bacterium]|nr:polyphenol oxidase family protein [Deltaproteobacteria bacterium]
MMKPVQRAGFWVWEEKVGDLEIRFTGKGPAGSAEATLEALEEVPPKVAFAKQVHSARVLVGHPGLCGEGDAVVTESSALAASVLTADCVPVLVASDRAVAAVHAGWRGLVADVIGAAIDQLPGSEDRLQAWIGPSIGVCCYEVGEEVANLVTASSQAEFAQPGPRGRPHLNLVAAAAFQLKESGVRRIGKVSACTRCDAETLWSYRRDGAGAGRNRAFIWRHGPGTDEARRQGGHHEA